MDDAVSDAQLAWLARYAADAYAAHQRLDHLGVPRHPSGGGAWLTLPERIDALLAGGATLAPPGAPEIESRPAALDDA
jgi:hypothetical protein